MTKLTAFIHSSVSELKFVVSRIKFLSEDLIMQMAERKRMMTVCKKSMPKENAPNTYCRFPVTDPGFPRREGGNRPLSLEQKPIILQDFFPKTA